MTHIRETAQKWRPDRKVGHAVAIGTPAGTIIAWAIEAGLTVDVPTAVAAAFGGLVTGLWAYFTRNK